MQTSIFALIAFAMLLAMGQSKKHSEKVAEYVIKQGLLSGGRSYEIKSEANAPEKFTIRNELFHVGKKLYLLEDGKERYSVKHDIFNLMSKWTIKEAGTDKELGTIENKLRFAGSKMTANGAFGHYTIHGNFGTHEYTIKKDGVKVARIHKARLHIHDTYDLTVYGDADRALMVLFTIIVDEIRQH